MILVIAPAVWLGERANKARQQRESVAAVQEFGGWVTYEDNYHRGKPSNHGWLQRLVGDEYFRQVAFVMLFDARPRLSLFPFGKDHIGPRNPGPADDVLAKLPGLTDVRIIHLGEAREPTDAGVAHLKGLRNLRDLAVDKSQLTDESLRHLSQLPRIEHLTLTGRRFSDKGLTYLRKAAHLKTLQLHSEQNGITDAGLASLKGLKELGLLDLSGSAITDTGLEQLKVLSNLKEVRVRGTQVTKAGRERFKAGMPKHTRTGSFCRF
jgi:hypothetical protein